MKKMWKIKKDSEGVSPVIATILMVAITVVLAAVLLVLVLNIGDDTTPPAASIQWNESEQAIVVQTIFPSTPKADIEFRNADDTLKQGNWSDGATGNVVGGLSFNFSTSVTEGEIIRMIYKPTNGAIAQTTIGVVAS